MIIEKIIEMMNMLEEMQKNPELRWKQLKRLLRQAWLQTENDPLKKRKKKLEKKKSED